MSRLAPRKIRHPFRSCIDASSQGVEGSWAAMDRIPEATVGSNGKIVAATFFAAGTRPGTLKLSSFSD